MTERGGEKKRKREGVRERERGRRETTSKYTLSIFVRICINITYIQYIIFVLNLGVLVNVCIF